MRIGFDIGGTKIEAVALDTAGAVLDRVRVSSPPDYEQTLDTVRDIVHGFEERLGQRGSVGVGMPGTLSPKTGLVKNANATWLNGRPFAQDLSRALTREVRCTNDANCLAASEATDGAAAGAAVVFAVILGSGCGGGVALHGRVHAGAHGVAGEWGHNGLPWPGPDEFPGPDCYCGKRGCIETWVSGKGFAADYARATGLARTGAEVADAARAGEPEAEAALERYTSRLARGLATVVNTLDPDVIVLGGGMSNVDRLYQTLPDLVAQYVFGREWDAPILRARYGDASGVRGAACLWNP
jgi:fructokinase